MSLPADATVSHCASLPALADEIARSLAGLARLPDQLAAADAGRGDMAPLADAARSLSEVQGALLIIDESGLAALVQLLRAQLLACSSAGSVSPQDLVRVAHSLQRMLRTALDALIAGRRPVAGELLACWQQLAALGGASDAHPSALVSLSLDADSLAALPLPASADAHQGSEQALLDFLRAQDDAQRAAAAVSIAGALAQACADAADADERVRWLALRAWLIEFAQAGGDAARAKKIVAATVRALRHVGEGAAVNASLAREALFELAQRPLVTGEARDVARLFKLERQFATPDSNSAAQLDDDVADPIFVKAIADAIAAVEADPARLNDSALWLALVDATTGSARFVPLAAPLREVASRAGDDPADLAARECLAAILLCVHACAQDGGYSDSGNAVDPRTLSEALNAAQTMSGLQAWSRTAGAHRLMLELSATLRSEMQHAEQALDGGMPADVARALAVATLDRIAGALQMLAIDAGRDALLGLRSRFDAADTATGSFDEALALQWVDLQESFALLPWRLREPATEPVVALAAVEASLLVDAGEDSLDAIFIDEAGSLLREWHEQLARPDAASIIHLAHTLAGCSSTVGASMIAELAHAVEDALSRGSAADTSLLNETQDVFEAMLAEFAANGRCGDASSLVQRWRSSVTVSSPIDADDAGGQGSCVATEEPIITSAIEYSIAIESGIEPDAATAAMADAAVSSSEPGIADPLPLTAAAAITTPQAPECESAEVDDSAHDGANDGEAELLAVFHEEAADLLPQIEQAVRAWQRQPDDRQQPAQLLRVLHTLKGSARMAAQDALGEDFHRAEAAVAALMQQAPSAVAAQLPALLERVDQWLQAVAGSSSAPTVESQAKADEAVAPVPPPVATDSASPLLRVRADRLAQFADSSAEVWVGNARIREGLQEQRRAVSDLSDDLARLRAQLRELEIEAESRILSRAVQGSSTDFDPLEFDRYTRLHELTRMMAESITDIAGVQRGLARQVEGLGSAASAQARDLRRLQSELQALRSQALHSVEGRLRHLLRQAARETGRDAELLIEGGEVEIERGLLDRLMGPLEHLLRNAVVHGIEPPDERERLGKPRAGKVTLHASLAGNELRLLLSDDGRGLDLARIRDRAIAIGLLRDDDGHDRHDAGMLAALIFEPGFSTASEVTALSGRGIGMDAVRVQLQALGGRIDMASEAGQGCRFAICLPASLASVQVILATAGRWRVALPATLLQQVLQLDPSQIRRDADACQIDWQGGAIRLLHLGNALGDASPPADDARVPVAVLRDGERLLAVRLDAIAGQREVIVKHPGAQLAQVPGLAGATLLGDGGIALIIDPFRLPAIAPLALPVTEATRAPLVLVVDDSLTVRRASQRLLERQGYAVALARDGIEALEQLQQQRPVAVLLDIEMPRMDGFELLAVLRDDARWRTLPVVMITSRIAERHRERAAALGATAYMGKPYDEDALLALLSPLSAPVLAVA